MTNQTWDLDALTPAQRDVLSLVCDTNSGSVALDADDPISFDVQLRASRALQALGIVTLNGDAAWPDYVVSLTEDGERWLLSLPEGSLSR